MRMLRAAVLFVALFVFWLLLSARLDPLFVALGLGSAALVTGLGVRLLDSVLGPPGETPSGIRPLAYLAFVIWLLSRVPPAGVHVARVVLDPRIPPDPGVARFRTGLATPAARAALANSITLVPGTMTLDLEGDELTVHAFTPAAVADLANGATQGRIAAAFGLPPDEPPTITWEPVGPTGGGAR